MTTLFVDVFRITDKAKLPFQATPGSAGFDLHYSGDSEVELRPGARSVALPTGLVLAIPFGYEGQVRPRSSMAAKDILVTNAPGTIDSDYRGEVKVLLKNIGDESYFVKPGDRIAQMVFAPVVTHVSYVVVADKEALSGTSTERGSGGFGSTGV